MAFREAIKSWIKNANFPSDNLTTVARCALPKCWANGDAICAWMQFLIQGWPFTGNKTVVNPATGVATFSGSRFIDYHFDLPANSNPALIKAKATDWAARIQAGVKAGDCKQVLMFLPVNMSDSHWQLTVLMVSGPLLCCCSLLDSHLTESFWVHRQPYLYARRRFFSTTRWRPPHPAT